MSIYSGAVKKPVTTALCFIAIIILGIFSYSKLSIDLLPKIEENFLMVMTVYPGASAGDVEINVSKPVENALNGISDLKHITSYSRENVSIVTLEFEYGVLIDNATNDVRDKLDIVKSMLPDDINNPILFKFGADDIPIMILSVKAEENNNALYKILDDKVANPLKRVKGVGTVSIGGTAKREINIYCDPYKLDAYGISIENIAQLIGVENRNMPGGSIDLGSHTYSLRVQGEFREAAEINDLVIGNNGGKTIYMRDVARVEDSMQERSQESYTNGKRGAIIIVQKQSGANSVDIAKQIRNKLPEIAQALPSGIELDIMIDSSTSITNTMNSLVETILTTLVIVMLVVFMFLGRWRATLIILVTIPVSLIGSFIYLLATGNTLNIISMSALSLAIGMVVDDSIVVLENITTHIERGSKPKQAAIYATKEMSLSVIASTLTMLAVFLPLTMISGMAGVLFRQLGWIVSIIMIISTVAALSLIPMMSSRMLKLESQQGKVFNFLFTPIKKGLNALENGYVKVLSWAVHHRKSVIVIAIALFGGSLLLVPGIKTEFFPTQDNSRISATIELPIGTRQSITHDVAMRIYNQFMESYPEIERFNISFGQANEDNTFANMSESGSYLISCNIKLYDVEDRKRGMIEISELMRRDLQQYTELKEFKVVSGGSGVGGEASVDVEIYGWEFAHTDAVAATVFNKLNQLPQCSQVTISRGDYIPEIQVDFDRQKLALNGLNITTVSAYIRNRFNGAVASNFREDGEEYDIRVRYAPEFRQSIEDIENILIYNNEGRGIKVRDLGQVVEEMTPPTIEHKERQRVVTVSAVVAKGTVLSELVEATEKVLSETSLPPEVTYRIGGLYETQQETFRDLFTLLALIIVLVFIVMASQFESLLDPFVIMFSIPFAFTGVILGLYATNTAMGVMVIIGVLILMGIVVKNGIVLIDYIKLCRERGMGIIYAVITSGKSRLRPVLMTTLTTVLGMVPMAIGMGEGSEMWQSMGMSVAWGLSVSTLVTLILVPTLYCVFAGGEMKRQRKE